MAKSTKCSVCQEGVQCQCSRFVSSPAHSFASSTSSHASFIYSSSHGVGISMFVLKQRTCGVYVPSIVQACVVDKCTIHDVRVPCTISHSGVQNSPVCKTPDDPSFLQLAALPTEVTVTHIPLCSCSSAGWPISPCKNAVFRWIR